MVGVDGDAAECVRPHRLLLGGMVCLSAKASVEAQTAAWDYALAHMHELHRRDVACFCGLDRPCHGDTYLELAAISARGSLRLD